MAARDAIDLTDTHPAPPNVSYFTSLKSASTTSSGLLPPLCDSPPLPAWSCGPAAPSAPGCAPAAPCCDSRVLLYIASASLCEAFDKVSAAASISAGSFDSSLVL